VYQATEDANAFGEELTRREQRHTAELQNVVEAAVSQHTATTAAAATEAAAASEKAAAQVLALADKLGRSERRAASLAAEVKRTEVEAGRAAAAAALAADRESLRLLEAGGHSPYISLPLVGCLT